MNAARHALYGWIVIGVVTLALLSLGIFWVYRYDQEDRVVGNLALDAGRSVRVVEGALGGFPGGRIVDGCIYTAEYWENGSLRDEASFVGDTYRATNVKIVADANGVAVILDGSTAFELTEDTWKVNGGR